MKYSFSLFFFTLLLSSMSSNGQLQKINTIGGIGTAGFSGDGGTATAAELNGPHSVIVDPIGNIYFVDYFNGRVRKINTFSKITTVAGNGSPGSGGDGSIATSVPFQPYAIAIDKKGNLFISDAILNNVRKVNTAGIISTVVGNGTAGYTGDGGAATIASLSRPNGLAFDAKGNLYIADAKNHVVRKVDTFGKIWTFAGIGSAGYTGDGGLATAAQLDSPYAVAVDRKGRVYISDYKINVVRRVETDGNISTYAGIGFAGYTGDNGPANMATFNGLAAIALDTIGNLFLSDANNNVIRKVDTFGVVTTFAGNGTAGYGGDLGYVNGANFQHPYGVAVDKYGSVYIADANNHRIRKTYSIVSVNDVPAGPGISVYPNPVQDVITLTSVAATDKVAVYTVTGAKVNVPEAAGDDARVINIANNAPGLYLIHVSDAQGNAKAVFKIVKE